MEDYLADIRQYVRNVTTYRIFPLLLESMLFALYTALMIFYCLRFYTKDTQRVWGLFLVSVSLYILSLLALALDVSVLWLQMYRLIPELLTTSVPDILLDDALARLNDRIHVAQHACELVTILLSDIITLWRAYLIYNRPKWLKCTSVAVVVLSAALYIVNETMISSAFWERYSAMYGSALATVIQAMTSSTTACAQIFATALVARKAWLHRRQLNELLPDRRGASKHHRPVAVLYIIIETGITYACLRVLYVLANFGTDFAVLGITAAYWVNALMSQISGMYPTLVVFLVSLRESLIERSVQNASGLVSIPIHLASASVVTGQDTERGTTLPESGEVPEALESEMKLKASHRNSV